MAVCGWDAVVEKMGNWLGGGDGVEWVVEWEWDVVKKGAVVVDEEVEEGGGSDWYCHCYSPSSASASL
jgi:hypothetical protein